MPIFKYNGDHESMKNVFGYDFTDHAEVEVPETDVRAVKKLSANSHFDLVETDESFDFGVFRVKDDGEPYSRPDRICDTMEEAEEALKDFDDGKERKILKKKKA